MNEVKFHMSREEFKAARAAGRKFCLATLYERQDFILHFGGDVVKPIREITNEPDHWHRTLGR